jgi:hypothetical protein
MATLISSRRDAKNACRTSTIRHQVVIIQTISRQAASFVPHQLPRVVRMFDLSLTLNALMVVTALIPFMVRLALFVSCSRWHGVIESASGGCWAHSRTS